MTEKEARRLCLLEMADVLAVEGGALEAEWSTFGIGTTELPAEDQRRIKKAAEALVQQWRDEAAALGE